MSNLPETHPEFVYVVLQGAGIISEGRPIRGNFYCYKLERKHAKALADLLATVGNLSGQVAAYLSKYEIKWSQQVDQKGYEVDSGNYR